jgi:tRNA dimethylallyltransferase
MNPGKPLSGGTAIPGCAPLIAIVGPTASGKSALAVWLAERLDGEVVACDSTQLYEGFDIGTAKPGLNERLGIPHHLIDVLTAREVATAGGYRQMAIRVLEDLRHRGRIPILTVGTGLYLRALLEGLADVPQRSEELRERLRAQNCAGRRTKIDSRNRSLPSRKAATLGSAPVGTHTTGRMARIENWPAATAGQTV